MGELLPVVVVLALGFVVAVLVVRGYPDAERKLLMAAFAAHVVGAFAQVGITELYYGGGDMNLYHRAGSALADFVRHNPSEYLPEVVRLVLRADPRLPMSVQSTGSATGSMVGISALLALPLNNSLFAMCLAPSMAAFFGQMALYKVFRESFGPRYWRPLLIGMLLLPSTVFWTSGLVKETVAVAGLGWAIFGIHRSLRRQLATGLLALGLGAMWVGFVKPYVFMPLGLGAGIWWYWRRAQRTRGEVAVVVKPFYLILGAAFAVGVVILVGKAFPRYAVDNIVSETAHLQVVGTRIRGGSNYALMDAPERSLAGQALYAPLALVTALFRPFLFEASGATALVNALETTIVSFVFVRAVWKLSIRRVWAILRTHPILMFSAVFVLTFGTAVGLASTNLGSLSRYRAPFMPFYLAFVVLLEMERRDLARSNAAQTSPGRRMNVRGGAATQGRTIEP